MTVPYIFGGLVLANALVLGYLTFIYQPVPTQSVVEARAHISAPTEHSNSAAFLPPLIGKKP